MSLAQEPGIQLSPRSQSLRVARPAWRQPSAALCPAHTGRGAGQGTSCPMPAQGQLAAGSPAQPAGDPGSCPRSAGEGPREQRGAGGCRCRIGCSWAPRPHSQAPTGRGSSSRSQGAGWAGAELPPPPGRPPPSTDHWRPALCTVLFECNGSHGLVCEPLSAIYDSITSIYTGPPLKTPTAEGGRRLGKRASPAPASPRRRPRPSVFPTDLYSQPGPHGPTLSEDRRIPGLSFYGPLTCSDGDKLGFITFICKSMKSLCYLI